MKKLWLGAAAASSALLIALTGCGDSGSTDKATDKPATSAPADPKMALAAAVKKTDQQTSARFKMQMSAGPVRVQGNGVMKFTSPMTGEFDMTMSAEGQKQKLQARYTRDAMYIGGDMLAGQTGKKWMKISYADLAKSAGPGLGEMLRSQMEQNQDPRQYLKLMLASQDLKIVGTETINGVETTHYRGTIDLEKALADSGALTSLSAKDREALRKQFRELKLNKVKAEIWVGDGWPLRIVQRGSTPQGAFTIRFDMSDFGVPVNVTAPPKSQVQDFGELLEQLQGKSS